MAAPKDWPTLEDVEQLRVENLALREMLEDATDQIHGEWGSGTRESYDWLPELAQKVCEISTGHPHLYLQERWNHKTGELLGQLVHCSDCGSFVRWATVGDLHSLEVSNSG